MISGYTVRRAGEAVSVLAAAAALLFACSANAAVYYVDFNSGNDAAAGTSTSTPWKRAPGDPKATGKAAATTLKPGDIVRFKGGVRYRGSVSVKVDGTASAPIIFDGSAWGSTRAVLDGSDPVSGQAACTSKSACLGASNWSSLQSFTVPTTARYSDWIFADDKPYMVAMNPAPASGFDWDDVNKWLGVPLSQLSAYQAGRINMAGLDPALASGGARLVLWTYGNQLQWADSFSIDANGISFVAPGFKPYTNRTNRFAIMNTPAMVNKPGTFAVSASNGRAIAMPHRSGAQFSIGARRNGFLLAGSDHIVVRGFVFTNFAGLPNDNRSGVPVLNTMGTRGVRVEQNIFRSVVLSNGQGAMSFFGSTDLSLTGNTIQTSPFSSGMRVVNSNGPVNLSCNSISGVGRTGIYIQNLLSAKIRGNYLSDINGHHGNGISAYLDNRNVEISDNVVVRSLRPMTLDGADKGAYFTSSAPYDIKVLRNTLAGTYSISGAISSWGGIKGVTISDNLLTGPKWSLRLSSADSNLKVTNNKLVGGFYTAGVSMTNSGNTIYDPSGNGATLITQANAATVAAGICS